MDYASAVAALDRLRAALDAPCPRNPAGAAAHHAGIENAFRDLQLDLAVSGDSPRRVEILRGLELVLKNWKAEGLPGDHPDYARVKAALDYFRAIA